MATEAVLEFTITDHPLQALIRPVLECGADEALSELHKRHENEKLPHEPPLCPTLQHAFRLGGRRLPGSWTARHRNLGKRYSKLLSSEPYKRWLEGYDAFVRAVILPACGEGIYYQRPPTLRIAMPCAHKATIGVHCDADYPGHTPGEINFWVPLVDVAESSALWLESSPGLGDFSARPLRVGQVLQFDGYRCRHHTQPNQSGTTRVSFDLRCIPASALAARGEAPPSMIGDYPCVFMSCRDDAHAAPASSRVADSNEPLHEKNIAN